MKQVQVKKLCKNYPSFSLSDVSFDLCSGRITGFIGRNVPRYEQKTLPIT